MEGCLTARPTRSPSRICRSPSPAQNSSRSGWRPPRSTPADLLMTAGTVREIVPLDFPFVPGTDVAGTVTKLGPGTKGFEVGEEVFRFGAPPSFAPGVGIPAVTSGPLAEYATLAPILVSSGGASVAPGCWA
ncbi:alcohol dehydrogenase catalytic domain-containing protein, partial [Actinopolymorpha pittospori]